MKASWAWGDPADHYVTIMIPKYLLYFKIVVAVQGYDTYVNQAHVIQGNDVIVKCDIPSFVTDFVQVVSWQDSEGKEFQANSVVSQGM